MKQKTRRHWSTGLRYRAVPHGMLRHTAACCGKFVAVCRSNRAQLDFSGMGPEATRGTARNVNAPVEIAGFDFSGTARGTARYRKVSEHYFTQHKGQEVNSSATKLFWHLSVAESLTIFGRQ
jgi:hypothetical protein